MAAARPVVATAVGGNAEVIREGETGFLVPAREPAQLAEALARATESPEAMRRLGIAGRDRVESFFSVRAMVRRTEQLYRELVLSEARAAA